MGLPHALFSEKLQLFSESIHIYYDNSARHYFVEFRQGRDTNEEGRQNLFSANVKYQMKGFD